MKLKNEMSTENYSLDSHGALYRKMKDIGKEFRALIVPKTTHKYILYESHNSLGHNGITRLHKLLKMQYDWKGLKESMQRYVRHCPQCQTTNLQTTYVQLHFEIP